MDGYVATLDAIVELAERYRALVMVDDSHAVGFMGPTGAGTPELFGVQDRVDIVTGTLGKALGGAWRLHRRPQRDRRDAAPTVPTAFLQFPSTFYWRRGHCHAGSASRHPASYCSGYVRIRRTSARKWLRVTSRFPNPITRLCRS